jgi:hypothetical protein
VTKTQIENGAKAIYDAAQIENGAKAIYDSVRGLVMWEELRDGERHRQCCKPYYRGLFLAALAYIREQATSELIGIAYMDDVRVVCNEDIFALLSPPPAKEQK